MNPRTAAILLVIAGALGAFVYFYEIRGASSREQAAKAERRVFRSLDADEIREIAFPQTEGGSVRALRADGEDGSWRIVSPLETRGDATALGAMARTLAEMESEGEIEDPAALDVYGLGDDARTVRFGPGDAGYTLRIGKATPLGGNVYVAARGPGAGAEIVHMIETWRANAFDRRLDDVRERRLLRFERDAARRVTLRWRAVRGADEPAVLAPLDEIVLEREQEDWSILVPASGERFDADGEAVTSLLSDLTFLRAEAFVDGELPDAETGLGEPEYEVTLELAEAEPPELRLRIGGPGEAGMRYAHATGADVALVSGARAAGLPRALFALRFKQLARFAPREVRALELRWPSPAGDGGAVTHRLDRDGESGRWSADESFAGMRLRHEDVRQLLTTLSSLSAENIAADRMGPAELAEIGLDPPRLVVRVLGVRADEGGEAAIVLAELRLGDSPSRDASRLVQIPDRGEVFRLAAEPSALLPMSAEGFVESFFEPEPAPEDPPVDAESAEAVTEPVE